MYDRREGFGSSCYRLLTKTGKFIYLRTHGYLEFDKKNGSFESFVCINTLVEKEEGEKLIKDLKERFSATVTHTSMPMIEGTSTFDQSNSKAGVEDPTQLEDVISHLLSDIASPTASDDQDLSSPAPDIQYAKAAIYAKKMPPLTVQTERIGIKNIESSEKGKLKRIKQESAGSPSYEQHNTDNYKSTQAHCSKTKSLNRQKVMSNYYIPDKVVPSITSPKSIESTGDIPKTHTVSNPFYENIFFFFGLIELIQFLSLFRKFHLQRFVIVINPEEKVYTKRCPSQRQRN